MSGAEVSQVGRAAYFGGRTEFVQISRAELLMRRALALPIYRIGSKLVRDGRTFRKLLTEASKASGDAGWVRVDGRLTTGEKIFAGSYTMTVPFFDISSSYPASMLREHP